jgi:hypothetical protein
MNTRVPCDYVKGPNEPTAGADHSRHQDPAKHQDPSSRNSEYSGMSKPKELTQQWQISYRKP